MSAYFRFSEESPLVEVTDVEDAQELIAVFQDLMSNNKVAVFNTGDGVTLLKNMGKVHGVVVYETTDERPAMNMQFKNS